MQCSLQYLPFPGAPSLLQSALLAYFGSQLSPFYSFLMKCLGHGTHHAGDLRPPVLAVPCVWLPTNDTPITPVHGSFGRALPMTAVCIAAQDLGRAVGVCKCECHCNLRKASQHIRGQPSALPYMGLHAGIGPGKNNCSCTHEQASQQH